MEFQLTALSELHFPRDEWKWLRRPLAYHPSPDFFLWAARVNGALWAWTPMGSDLEGSASSACQAVGAKVPVLVLESDGGELTAHGFYLKTAFTAVAPADVEWVAALDVLQNRLGHDPAAAGLPPLWKEALEAAGLAPHLGALGQRGRYFFLTQAERQTVFEKKWDLAALELLETWNAPLREAFLEAVRRWNVTAAQVKEASNHVLILSRKVGEAAALRVLKSEFTSAETFRSALLHTAQPELASLSQARIEKLRGLNLPPRTAIFGDPSFEKDVLKLTHTPRTMGDFQAFKTWIENTETAEKIRALLEIYQ